eukprot:9723706-Alexandrium_andersonii.AAC.1
MKGIRHNERQRRAWLLPPRLRPHADVPSPSSRTLRENAAARAAKGQKNCSNPDCSRRARTEFERL